MGANCYTATFQNETVKRTSGRPYDAAWKVAWVSGYDGKTYSETGFSRTHELASAAADARISSVTKRPRGWRYHTAGFKPGTLVSREVVRTEIVHQIATKARNVYVANFADGTTKTREAGVPYRFAVRLSWFTCPNEDKRTEWVQWFFAADVAQAKTADAITSHQDFYRKHWKDCANWDCQAQVEIVPVLTVGEQTVPVQGTEIVLTVNHTAAGQTRLIVTDGGLVKSDETVPSRDYLAAEHLIVNAAQGQVLAAAQ
jgi:hypothetical protein